MLVALAAVIISRPEMRLAAALLGVIVVTAAIAAAGDLLTPPDNRIVRVAPGSGFWVCWWRSACWPPMPSRACGRGPLHG